MVDGGWSDGGWSDGGTITFLVPEHAARGIVHLAAEEGNLWPGFGTGLAVKMSDFVAAIV